MKQLYLQAPDDQIAKEIIPLIEKWDDEPKAIQVLETLDAIVYNGAGSSFAVSSLDLYVKQLLIKEGITYEELLKQAHWRSK